MNNLELSNLCYQLSIVFKSGLPIADGLKVLATDFDDENSSAILNTIADKLDDGKSIADSFDSVEELPLYLREFIRVGEDTGQLPRVLDDLTNYYKDKADLSKKIKSAVTYPAILFVMMIFVIGLLVFKVLPIFHGLLESLGGEVPAATLIIYEASVILKTVFIYIVGIIIALMVVLLIVFKVPGLSKLRSGVLLKMPFVKKIYKKNLLVRFTSALDTLVNSGYPMEISIEKAIPILEDGVIKDKIVKLNEKSKLDQDEGDFSLGSVSIEMLEEVGIFPSLFFKMVGLGNKTGTLGEMLTRFNHVYKEELDRQVSRSSDMIEPILVSIMAVIIAIILILTILPLIGVISAIG